MKAQYPAPITDFRVKFWRYTLGDLARIGIPLLSGAYAAGIAGALLGAVVGFGLAELQIYGKTVDKILVDLILSQVGKSQIATSVETADEAIITEDGTAVGVVEVSSVDLDMASDMDWQVNRDTVANLYREIEEPVEIHSRKRRVDLSGYQCIRDSAVTTDHYLIVKEQPGSEPEPKVDRIKSVADKCRGIRNSLNAGDLSAEHITGKSLMDVLRQLHPPDPSLNEIIDSTVSSLEDLNLTDISPEPSHYKTGDNYRRLIAISEYPEEYNPGLLSDILNLNTAGFVDIVQTIEPVSDKQRRKLSRLIGRMRAESLATPDPIRSSEIDRKLTDAENLIDVEQSGGERLINVAAYIIVRGTTEEQVSDTLEDVRRLLRRSGIEYREPWLETPQAVQTESAIHPDRLQYSLMMPSRSAAASFSFSTHDKFEEGGISFGIDTRNGMPVILNRYSWEASHIARMGKIGSGKSYFAKLSLYRSWHAYPDLHVHVIDPKQEYGTLIDELGGETIVLDKQDFNESETGPVTRYTVADRSQDNTELLTDAVRHVYRVASVDTTPTIVLVDEAHRLLTDSSGRVALGELVREGRDRNISVEMITQNASDFTHSREGRDILKNVNCYIFMQHQDVETGVSDFFNLSPRETVALRRLRTGTDLPFSEAIIRGPVNTKLRIQATDHEHTVITK